MNFKPAPGIILVEPIEKDDSIVILGKNNTRVLKGKVIAVGNDLLTNANAQLERTWYCEVGNIVYFLSYEGEYDNAQIEGKKYYMVKFEDIRGVYEK